MSNSDLETIRLAMEKQVVSSVHNPIGPVEPITQDAGTP